MVPFFVHAQYPLQLSRDLFRSPEGSGIPFIVLTGFTMISFLLYGNVQSIKSPVIALFSYCFLPFFLRIKVMCLSRSSWSSRAGISGRGLWKLVWV